MGKILAHELAHVLGVMHDGDGNECDGKISAHRQILKIIIYDILI